MNDIKELRALVDALKVALAEKKLEPIVGKNDKSFLDISPATVVQRRRRGNGGGL